MACFKQLVKMVGKQRPGLATRMALQDDPLQPLQEIIPIVVAANLAPLDNVMQPPRGHLFWFVLAILNATELIEFWLGYNFQYRKTYYPQPA